uniref:Uncharacterized protein n=1 Tax=Romanomermis culicivorax TaxID=13658 RepID=A0A915KAQ5_ROMCU
MEVVLKKNLCENCFTSWKNLDVLSTEHNIDLLLSTAASLKNLILGVSRPKMEE